MNYPLNETYATLIPALLMGNVVLMKVPTVGKNTAVETMAYICAIVTIDTHTGNIFCYAFTIFQVVSFTRW